MSRATAAPSAANAVNAPPVVARSDPSSGRPAAAGGSTALPRSSAALGSALEGTPGRMRLLAFLGAVVAAAVGLVGAMSLWSSAGALQRADHNTAQVVRIQGIYADLVRADADATNSFLVGGIEDPAKRADYDASMDRVAKGIAAAAQAQPADSDALGVLNGKVQTYASTVEQARVTNRQGLPVGATYLSNASATLRADILPIVKGLVDANKARADIEFDAASRLLTLVLVGLGGLAVLVLVMVWLARRTHRYLNPSLFVGTMVVVAALAVGIVTLAGVGSQVQQVRNSDFAYTVKLADARTAAYDAKSNESLTLIARGSGSAYETAWQQQSNNLISSLYSLDDTTENRLKAEWNDYVAAHGDIRKADDTGNWDAAVQAALATDEKSANAKFTTFTNDADKTLAKYGTDTQNSLLGPVGWVTVIGWLLLGLCVAAAVLVLRGMGQRIEEYR
jgi:CHASE3 domain sensor protein